MDRRRAAPRADRGADETAETVAPAVPRLPGVVSQETGTELREKVELWLTWRRIAGEVAEGTLGGDFDPADRTEIRVKVTDAEQAARDEVWGGYRFVVLADVQGAGGLEAIDLGAGHASASESLCGRVMSAL